MGYKNEQTCPPCLRGNCGAAGIVTKADDDCCICYTEPLSEAPVIMASTFSYMCVYVYKMCIISLF